MKTKIATLAIALAAIVLQTAPADATELSILGGSYRFSGSARLFSNANYSPMYQRGMGYGRYQGGSVTATVSNDSYYQSGTVVVNLWVSSYIGATSGRVVYSNGWGANRNYVFSGNQTWTCTKPGYRKIISRGGYASLGVHEYAGGSSWPMRDEKYFSGYSLW